MATSTMRMMTTMTVEEMAARASVWPLFGRRAAVRRQTWRECERPAVLPSVQRLMRRRWMRRWTLLSKAKTERWVCPLANGRQSATEATRRTRWVWRRRRRRRAADSKQWMTKMPTTMTKKKWQTCPMWIAIARSTRAPFARPFAQTTIAAVVWRTRRAPQSCPPGRMGKRSNGIGMARDENRNKFAA